MRILVTGAGGFIGHHLAKRLVSDGHRVVGIDIKEPEFEQTGATAFYLYDLRRPESAMSAFECHGPFDRVYHLAADMGGIGFIETNKAAIVLHNTLINMNTIVAAHATKVGRFLFSSSACVYPGYKQKSEDATPLREEDAYPADAEDGYGWEKLYMERTCRHFQEDFGLDVRLVRFHNVYGPLGTYQGGREKSPAALCRKIAMSRDGDDIEIWGDGTQTRSYCYIDDCVEGLTRLMESSYSGPLNLGTNRLISIDNLAKLIANIAGKRVSLRHDTTKPQGVRGRNSDNSALARVLGWTPSITLEDGLGQTYSWIAGELAR